MPLTRNQSILLIEGLKRSGWKESADSIIAPNGTLWFLLKDPWYEGLEEFLSTMKAKRDRIHTVTVAGIAQSEGEKAISDHDALILVLEMVKAAT